MLMTFHFNVKSNHGISSYEISDFSTPHDFYWLPQSPTALQNLACVPSTLALFGLALERRPLGRPGSIHQVSRWDTSLGESIKLNLQEYSQGILILLIPQGLCMKCDI